MHTNTSLTKTSQFAPVGVIKMRLEGIFARAGTHLPDACHSTIMSGPISLDFLAARPTNTLHDIQRELIIVLLFVHIEVVLWNGISDLAGR